MIGHPELTKRKASGHKAHIATRSFQAVTFFDDAQKRQVVILYALGEDGILREFVGGKWHPYAVT